MYREPAAPTEAVELSRVAGSVPWGRWGEWRWGDRLVRYLGPRVVVTGHGYLSLDGIRRVRFVPGEKHARFEEIDGLCGITRRSHRVRSCACAGPVEAPAPLAKLHAHLLGRSTSQVCFEGLPRALGGRPRATTASMVRLVEHVDGVRLDRVGPAGRVVADSWHVSVEAAFGQLEHEYGPHVGRIREGQGCLGALHHVGRAPRGVWT